MEGWAGLGVGGMDPYFPGSLAGGGVGSLQEQRGEEQGLP